MSERTFHTKTGFCHVLPDKLVLTNDGNIDNVRHIKPIVVKGVLPKLFFTYSIITSLLFYFAYDLYRQGNRFQPAAIALIGLFIIYGVLTSLNNSAAPVIERNAIKSVAFKKSIRGLTRSRFEIQFEEAGKIKKRLILLPGLLQSGQSQSAKALEIMMAEKLL